MFTGLVADLGTVRALESTQDGVRVTIATRLAGELANGDSIAVNGVCLTVASVDGHGLSVALIPETLERTTFGDVAAGTRLNVEVDVLAKHVEKLLAAANSGTPATALAAARAGASGASAP